MLKKRMRIAFVTGHFLSPSVTFIVNQVTGLLDRGFDVEVFADDGDRSVLHEDVHRYGLLERTHVWPRGPQRSLRAALRGAIAQPTKLPALVRAAVPRQGERPNALVRRVARLGAFVQRPPFDVIVAHFGNHGAEMQSLRELGGSKAPLVTFFHGADMSRWLDQKGKGTYAHLFERGELMLSISDFWVKRLVELGCPAEKIRVHRMGVDLRKISFKERTIKPGERVQILSVARLTEKKGLSYAIDAMNLLRQKRDDFDFHIVGDGPLRAELEAQVKRLDIASNVHLHGWKTQEQIFALQDSVHIGLTPSVTASDGDMEGLPVALMESLAAGLPVVSTYHSGIPELVKDGECGYLVQERDVPALAERLERLIESPELLVRFGRRGRELVEADFEIEALNDRLASLLREVAKRPS
jgi:colanic acid/amylovoran biosynthesis glycosyltransferase